VRLSSTRELPTGLRRESKPRIVPGSCALPTPRQRPSHQVVHRDEPASDAVHELAVQDHAGVEAGRGGAVRGRAAIERRHSTKRQHCFEQAVNMPGPREQAWRSSRGALDPR